MRKSGILLPVTSLPSKHGIGSLGRAAYEWIDFLERAGQKIWQVLPVNSTCEEQLFSPYKSPGAFSFNYDMIDLDLLKDAGLIQEDILFDFGCDPRYIDYPKVRRGKLEYLKKAYRNRHLLDEKDVLDFQEKNSFWLEDFASHMSYYEIRKSSLEGEELRPSLLGREELSDFYKFTQYLFFTQWKKLKTYANRKGIQLFGDIPIYVAEDGSDLAFRKELFLTDENGELNKVAGVPPDAFSSEGQIWGNPLYDWEALKKTDYDWWIQRIGSSFELYDILRIDHFRAFDEFYAIDAKTLDARTGEWMKGPGKDFFDELKRKLPDVSIVAEDLGMITDSVRRLLEYTGYPGMRILQFAFDGNPQNPHLPHNHIRNSVVYTGTHDNKTTTQWLQTEDSSSINHAVRYLRLSSFNRYTDGFISAALSSVADTCIIPIQDYLDYGEFARINSPGTTDYNWTFRLLEGECDSELADKIAEMTRFYGR